MSYQPSSPKKSNAGLWLGGAAILLVALIAVVVLLLNRQPAPAAPAAAVIVSAVTATSEPVDAAPTAVDTPAPASTETPTSTPIPELGTSNLFVEYILDASGSMAETLRDGTLKVEVAKRVLTEHMRSFRPETNVGLRVYGHRLPYQQTEESCRDIELIAPPEKGQMERIVSWLQDFTVQGMTPLAASLDLAKDDFVYDASRINSIVLLSDGIETCGGDPCQLVEDLKAEGINFTIHVIGLDVDDPTRQQLMCIARAGGGKYHDAQSQQELNAALGAVQTDVTRDEVVVPPGVNTPTPAQTDIPEPSTSAPVLGDSTTMISEIDGMMLVYVPAGEFLMGSTDADPMADSDEKPQHTVYLDAFWIDKTEVTAAQYQRCVETDACSAPDTGGDCTYGADGESDHPINCLVWDQAASYCTWAGRRLPTEAEWEKAARGTDGRVYPWGNSFDGSEVNFCDVNSPHDHRDALWDDGYEITAPVASYPSGASPYGALDMVGNVWEWVADWYNGGYYAQSPRNNPTGPGSGDDRVLRGGSWINSAADVRAAARGALTPDDRVNGVGFRCARSP